MLISMFLVKIIINDIVLLCIKKQAINIRLVVVDLVVVMLLFINYETLKLRRNVSLRLTYAQYTPIYKYGIV